LTVDDSGAVAAVNNMTTALDKADNSTQSLKAQLREMQANLATLDVNSEEFEKLSRAAGKLKDQINDASEAVRANAGNAFESLSNNSAVLRQRLFDLDFEGAGQSVKALAVSAKNLTFKEATAGIKGLTSGLADLGKAILTNPILLIGGALVAIIANFEKLTQVGGAVGNFFSGIATLIDDVKTGLMDLTDAIGLTDFKAQELAENQKKRNEDAKKNLQEFAEGLDSDIEAKKRKFIQDADGNLKLASENFKKYVDATKAENTRLISAYDESIAAGRKVDQFTEDRVKAAIRENKLLEASIKDLEKQSTDSDAAVTESQKREADKQKDIRDKALKERQAQALFLFELQQRLDNIGEQRAKEIQARINNTLASFAQKSKLLETSAFGDAETAAQLRFDLTASEQDKELSALDEQYKEKRRLAGNDAELRKLLTEEYLKKEQEIKDKYAAQDEATQRELNTKKVQLAADAFGALAALDAAFSANNKKGARAAFNRNKAYGIAQASIQTGLAVTAALTAGGNPIKLATGTQFIEAGIAAATGIAQIAKIASTKFNEGGDASGAGGGGVPSVGGGGGGNVGTVPTFNAMNLGFLQNRPEQTPKAYVLAQDVSSAVEARDKVRDLARIN
ncbi:MAG: hypothetical protein EBR30_26400, partial [Cytophagia bacterium]|nr:hypothetical protein [Cytophagia bacterium]